MLQEPVFTFLKDLEKHNNKPWFDAHREQYEQARAIFISFVSAVIRETGAFEKEIGGFSAKDCIFRINRDVRFSKDKRPYKSNFAAYFNKDGKNGLGAGYYINIQPGKCMLGGGIWMPEPAVLAKIRQEIDYNFNEWKKILGNKTFKTCFPSGLENMDKLLRPPKGFSADNPALEFLKMKNYVVTRSFPNKAVMEKGFAKEVARHYKTMKPFIDFLNRSLD